MLPEMIVAMCLSAHCTLPVTTAIVPPSYMPKGIVATTTVSGGVCALTFTPKSAKSREVVAHEVCHCARDYDVIGPYGYEGISDDERDRRERKVRLCGRLLGR